MNTTFTYRGYSFTDNDKVKTIHGNGYNFFFSKIDGYFERWGATRDDGDDPVYCDLGPQLADIQIVKDITEDQYEKYRGQILVQGNSCKGCCPFCYKGNGSTKYSHYMTLQKFKTVLMQLANTHVKYHGKLVFFNDPVIYNGKVMRVIDVPDIDWQTDICNCSPLTQLALGLTNLDANPQLLQICSFAKRLGIVPNITCHGKDDVGDEFLQALAKYCGNMAVSRYDKQKTYNFIERLSHAGLSYISLHFVLSDESYRQAIQTLRDRKNDPRIANCSSVVFLFVKQKGRGKGWSNITDEHLAQVFNYSIQNQVPFGIDVCSYWRFMKFFENQTKTKQDMFIRNCIDSCDSCKFSCYVNTLGQFCPCSFIQGDGIWENSPNILKCGNFVDQVWNGQQSQLYRTLLVSNGNNCLYYKI